MGRAGSLTETMAQGRSHEGNLDLCAAAMFFCCRCKACVSTFAKTGPCRGTHQETAMARLAPSLMDGRLTAVGLEPTPFRNGALSHRLRPLGQTVMEFARARAFRSLRGPVTRASVAGSVRRVQSAPPCCLPQHATRQPSPAHPWTPSLIAS